jgi:hypothetical protein
MQVNTTKNEPITYVAFVVDESGSMSSLRHRTIESVKSMVESVRNQGKTQKVFLSLLSFNDLVNVALPPTDVSRLANLSIDSYNPRGGTALFDAVGEAAEQLRRAAYGNGHDQASFLVVAFTDGDENRSSRYNGTSLNLLIGKLQAEGSWTLTFQVPRGMSHYLTRLGISTDNIREWEQTDRGMQELAVTTNTGMTAYFTERSKGVRSVNSFYAKVKTDLGKVSDSQIKRSLDNVTGDYRLFTTTKETRIDEFVALATKRPYVTGSTFYQLMKPEKVQPQKGVLLLDKRDDRVYGGNGARDIVGLPDGQYARVNPGNHSNYEIFVQSTSQNRILPRGTKVLVRL